MGYWKYIGEIDHYDILQTHPEINKHDWKQFDVDASWGYYFFEPTKMQSGSWVAREENAYPYTNGFYSSYTPGYYADPWEDEYSDHYIATGPSGPLYLKDENYYHFFNPGTFSFNYYYITYGYIGPTHSEPGWVYPGSGGYPEMHVIRWHRDGTNPEYSRIRDPILHYSYDWQEQAHIKEVAHNAVLITKGAEPYPDNPHVYSIRQAVVGVNGTNIDSGTIIWTKWADRASGYSYLSGYDNDYPEIRVYAAYHDEYEWDIGDRCYSSGGINGAITDIGPAKTLDLSYTYVSPILGYGVKDSGLLYQNIVDTGATYMPNHIFGYIHDYSSGPNPEFGGITVSTTTILSLDGSVTLGTIEVPMEVILPTTYGDDGPSVLDPETVLNNQLVAISFTAGGIPNIASKYGDLYMWNGTSYTHTIDTRYWDWTKDELIAVCNNITYTYEDGSFWKGWGPYATKRVVYFGGKIYLITEKIVNYNDDPNDSYKVMVWQYVSDAQEIGLASIGPLYTSASKYNGKYVGG